MKERDILDLCTLISSGHDIISKINRVLAHPIELKSDKISKLIIGYGNLILINKKVKTYENSGILEIEEMVDSFDNLLKSSYVNWMMYIHKWYDK